jgi:predicted restriction endonuclease
MTSAETQKLDRLWSSLVRELHGSNCLRCGSADLVQAAHLVPRRHREVRHDIRNGIPLCWQCHYQHDQENFDALTWARKWAGPELWAELQAAKNTFVKNLDYITVKDELKFQAKEIRANGN